MNWVPLILASSLFLSVYDIAKKKSVKGNHVLAVLFWATAVGTLAFMLYLIGTGAFLPLFKVSAGDLLLLSGKALLVSASWIFAYYAMRALPISIVAPIRASAPLWTLVGALILYHEIPTLWQGIGMGLILVGYLGFSLAGRAEGIRFTRDKGIIYVFLGTVLGALSALYDKFLLQTCGIERNIFQFWSSLMILLLLGIVWQVMERRRWEPTPFKWRWTIPLIGIFLTLADWCYFRALSQEGVAISILSMIRRSSVVLTFAAGALFFHERNFKRKTPALAAILLGVALLCLAKS